MRNTFHHSMSAAALMVMSFACAGCANRHSTNNLASSLIAAEEAIKPTHFVQQSQPETLEYQPVGVKAPMREQMPLTEEELKALEAQLEKRRARNEAAAATARMLGSTPILKLPVNAPVKKR